jgi:hypothetical protein
VCVCVCLSVCLWSGRLLYIVQACLWETMRFSLLVIFVMLPFVAGLSQRYADSTYPTPWTLSQNSTVDNTTRWDDRNWTKTIYTRNATGFETFWVSGGSFMKTFVDVGEILPLFLTLESILLARIIKEVNLQGRGPLWMAAKTKHTSWVYRDSSLCGPHTFFWP